MIRIISIALIFFYGVLHSAALAFIFLWDNKGASTIWEKSIHDWFIVLWLFVSGAVIWISIFKIVFRAIKSKNYIYLMGLIVVVQLVYLFLTVGVDGGMNIFIPSVILGSGVALQFVSRVEKFELKS